MTGFDFIVLTIVAITAVGGFLRGFVQEILSLAAWVLTILAIYSLHTPLTDQLISFFSGDLQTASILAFVLLLLIPYAAMKLIARRLGEASRTSVLGPIDRVLGFGFGMIKGVIISVMAFSLLVLGYDTVWGPAGRPTWITTARTYPMIDAASDAMVQMIDNRRARLKEEQAEG
ncbi:CvpA family protein [Altererythrobacter sp. CAU 1778]